jgi:hypothetical protein
MRRQNRHAFFLLVGNWYHAVLLFLLLLLLSSPPSTRSHYYLGLSLSLSLSLCFLKYFVLRTIPRSTNLLVAQQQQQQQQQKEEGSSANYRSDNVPVPVRSTRYSGYRYNTYRTVCSSPNGELARVVHEIRVSNGCTILIKVVHYSAQCARGPMFPRFIGSLAHEYGSASKKKRACFKYGSVACLF